MPSQNVSPLPKTGSHLGLWAGYAIGVNATIGTGIFRKPAQTASLTQDPTVHLLIWALGALIALCGAWMIAELGTRYTEHGGIVAYLNRAYGSRTAFVFAWTKLLLLTPSAVGSFANTAADALHSVDLHLPYQRMASAIVVCIAALNLGTLRLNSWSQTMLTALKIGGILFFIFFLFSVPSLPPPTPYPSYQPPWTSYGMALIAVMWAYDGWADISYVSGFLKDPKRSLPMLMAASVLTVATLYLLVCSGLMSAIGFTRHVSQPNGFIALQAMEWLSLKHSWTFMMLVFVSTVGGAMASLFTGSKVLMHPSCDVIIPTPLQSNLQRRDKLGVLVAGIMSLLFVNFRSFAQMTDAFVLGYFPFYLLCAFALIKDRRSGPPAHGFRMPWYRITMPIFVVASLGMLLSSVLEMDANILLSLGLIALGFGVHGILSRKKTRQKLL